jgi:integrase
VTAVRRSELIGARWSELDLEAKAPVWDIPAEGTKTGVAFAVPITPPAVEQFKRLKRMAGTTIPNHPGDMPEGTLRAILKQAGIEPEVFLQKK